MSIGTNPPNTKKYFIYAALFAALAIAGLIAMIVCIVERAVPVAVFAGVVLVAGVIGTLRNANKRDKIKMDTANEQYQRAVDATPRVVIQTKTAASSSAVATAMPSARNDMFGALGDNQSAGSIYKASGGFDFAGIFVAFGGGCLAMAILAVPYAAGLYGLELMLQKVSKAPYVIWLILDVAFAVGIGVGVKKGAKAAHLWNNWAQKIIGGACGLIGWAAGTAIFIYMIMHKFNINIEQYIDAVIESGSFIFTLGSGALVLILTAVFSHIEESYCTRCRKWASRVDLREFTSVENIDDFVTAIRAGEIEVLNQLEPTTAGATEHINFRFDVCPDCKFRVMWVDLVSQRAPAEMKKDETPKSVELIKALIVDGARLDPILANLKSKEQN